MPTTNLPSNQWLIWCQTRCMVYGSFVLQCIWIVYLQDKDIYVSFLERTVKIFNMKSHWFGYGMGWMARISFGWRLLTWFSVDHTHVEKSCDCVKKSMLEASDFKNLTWLMPNKSQEKHVTVWKNQRWRQTILKISLETPRI